MGNTDPQDYYRILVSSNATLQVAGSNVLGRVVIQLFEDMPTINEAMPTWALDTVGATSSVGMHNVASGTYYIRVIPAANTNALYTLELYTQ